MATLRVGIGPRLNAPFGARCFLTGQAASVRASPTTPSLNAPFGARCFLTESVLCLTSFVMMILNAPFGARCFLTSRKEKLLQYNVVACLNAPFGARCFLTIPIRSGLTSLLRGLMHLMALGAF